MMITRQMNIILQSIFLLNFIVGSTLASLSVKLAADVEQCFVIRSPGNEPSHVTGSYDMLDDELSADPVTAILFDSKGTVLWHSKPGATEGNFAFTGTGRFHLCFGNGSGAYKTPEDYLREELRQKGHHFDDDHFDYSNHDGQDRTIGFTIRVNPTSGNYEEQLKSNNADEKNTGGFDAQSSKLNDFAQALADKMELLMDHQQYLKTREASHRTLVENTFSLVMKYTIMEALVLVSIATLQVLYLKKFFETKRYL